MKHIIVALACVLFLASCTTTRGVGVLSGQKEPPSSFSETFYFTENGALYDESLVRETALFERIKQHPELCRESSRDKGQGIYIESDNPTLAKKYRSHWQSLLKETTSCDWMKPTSYLRHPENAVTIRNFYLPRK